jgi:hypothetical protein
MGDWLLVVVIIGSSVDDVREVQFVPMPMAQCESVLHVMKPVRRRVGLACVGPDGARIVQDEAAE